MATIRKKKMSTSVGQAPVADAQELMHLVSNVQEF